MKLSLRQKFERVAKRLQLPIGRNIEVGPNGPRDRGYFDRDTQLCWLVWQAARRVRA